MRFTLDVIVLVAPARSPAALACPLCTCSTCLTASMAQSSFNHDFGAVDLRKPNRVVEVLPFALQEIQTRMISPLQALSWGRVRPCLQPAPRCRSRAPSIVEPLAQHALAQGARKAKACIREYSRVCGELLEVVLAQGPPADGDNSVGAALRRARHLSTGLRLAAEVHWDALLLWAGLAGCPPAEGMPYTPAGSNACPCSAGARLTPAQLKAEIGVFILGGFATTAHALSYTLFALAAKPVVQRAIEAELSAAGLLTPDMQAQRQLQQGDLRSLAYLSFVIKESLRMFPVIAGVPRCGRRQSSAAWVGAARPSCA